MVVLSCFFCFFNYESPIIVVSILELTVYMLDGLIFGFVFFQIWI